MKRLLIIAAAALFPVAAAAQSEVSRAIAAMSGQQAQFVQKFTARGFSRPQVESGTVIFGPTPKMRWTYASPEKKTFVFDGTTSWFYVPTDRQVMINQLTEAERLVVVADRKAEGCLVELQDLLHVRFDVDDRRSKAQARHYRFSPIAAFNAPARATGSRSRRIASAAGSTIARRNASP